MKEIYLDNNATTKVSDRVREAMLPYLESEFGNPGSLYILGRNVKSKIDDARKSVADLLNAQPSEIVFTASASESNATAIMSAVRSNPSKRRIITTRVEHASIMEAMKYLESIGYDIVYLDVDKNGKIDLKKLEESINENTLLITVMFANNEIGNIYPIREIGKIARKHNIIFHTDATQAIGKFKVDVKNLGVDMLSFAGHKINAPKGIGVLYLKEGVPFVPLVFGHQEGNRRGGTENVPYIIGLGEAAREILEDDFKEEKRIEELRDYLERELDERIEGVLFYGDKEHRTPNTTNIAFEGVRGEELAMVLETHRIYVSTGSACNSHISEASHVLVAINADLEKYSPIRVSLGKQTTKEEIDEFIRILENVVEMLRRRK